MKTVYLRTSTTLAAGDTVTRTEYVFDDEDRVCQVLVYTGDAQTGSYQVECDGYGNYIRWTGDGPESRYTYDDRGHLLSYGTYVDDVQIASTEYTWEDDRRTCVVRRMQGTEYRTDLIYDREGRLIRQDDHCDGILLDYSIYILGEDGRPTKLDTYHTDGTLSQTLVYRYDGNTVTATGDDGSVTEQIFDDDGNLLSQTEYAADGTVTQRQTHTWKAIRVPHDCPRASQ